MKLYVNPVSLACPASCTFCITKFRKKDDQNELLKLATLRDILKKHKFTKIEITGGGEPTLHPQIDEIIRVCAAHAPTIMYTNAGTKPTKGVALLTELCISRAHFNDKKNQKIMGVDYKIMDFKKFGTPIKFSLMLHQSGIHTLAGIKRYVQWAKEYAHKVVVRQLFEYENTEYRKFIKKERVSTEGLAKAFVKNSGSAPPEQNIFINVDGFIVEFETRNCACENNNPVLYASGELKDGWE